jgi:hypothetical protein
MRRREARMPHLRLSETSMHLRRAAKEARHPTKLHPDTRAYTRLVIPDGSRDSGSSIEKSAYTKWTGAKVRSSPVTPTDLPCDLEITCRAEM